MRTAKEILPALRNEAPALASVIPLKPDEGTVSVINSLFRELMSIFPAWKQAWPDKEALGAAKATWTKAFMSERICRIEQIRYGIEQCRKLGTDFAPSVGRFIAMCQPTPEMLGIPSVDRAFREACRNVHPGMAGVAEWSHAAVYHAASESGLANLNTLPQDASRRLFERNYQIAVRALVAGEPLRKMPLALPLKTATKSEQKVGQDALQALRASRGVAR